jgi:hypothetical protein
VVLALKALNGVPASCLSRIRLAQLYTQLFENMATQVGLIQ